MKFENTRTTLLFRVHFQKRLARVAASVVLAFSLAGAMAVPIVTAGCATNATVARKGFTTIANAAAGVKLAMDAFNVEYQNHRATEAQRTQVLKTYAIYQTAALQAVSDQEAGRPVDGLKIINDAAMPVLDLIASFRSTP